MTFMGAAMRRERVCEETPGGGQHFAGQPSSPKKFLEPVHHGRRVDRLAHDAGALWLAELPNMLSPNWVKQILVADLDRIGLDQVAHQHGADHRSMRVGQIVLMTSAVSGSLSQERVPGGESHDGAA